MGEALVELVSGIEKILFSLALYALVIQANIILWKMW